MRRMIVVVAMEPAADLVIVPVLMSVAVAMFAPVVVIVPGPMRVRVAVMMAGVTVTVVMLVPVMETLVGMGTAGVLAEYEGLDRYRHRARGKADPPEINEVEIPQGHAVDDQDV